jgi:hypothetical protein
LELSCVIFFFFFTDLIYLVNFLCVFRLVTDIPGTTGLTAFGGGSPLSLSLLFLR